MHRSERTVYYTSQNVDTDRTLMASCHSHPSNNYHPSQADITSFRKKPVNIIMASPFRITSMGVYDAQGTPLAFDLKQVEDADDPSEEL
jgi:proteasome lid subunit RPN8/RPN11